MGKTFFDSLEKYCRTDAGFAALVNVETKEKRDDMESFFLAETLKYLYLLYAPSQRSICTKWSSTPKPIPCRGRGKSRHLGFQQSLCIRARL